MRHRRFGRLLFQGNNGAGFRAVNGFCKKYYPKLAQVWRFFAKPAGLDLDSPLRSH